MVRAITLRNLVASGKYSQAKQIRILIHILEDAKETLKLASNETLNSRINGCQKVLGRQNDLSSAIVTVNNLIADLEQTPEARATIAYLKQKGLYRILYRNPQRLGQELPEDDGLNRVLRSGFIGIGISAVLILFFLTTTLLAAPFWVIALSTGLFVGASTYLSGILYGVVNDLFATHANLPYFLLGHQPQQTSLLRTNNKIAQGIAWGVAATFAPVLIAAIVFTIAATITAFFVPLATFLLPLLMISMPLIAVGAEFYARKKTQAYLEENQYGIRLNGANAYQKEGLEYMCPTNEERAAWFANSDRNMFGFTKVPFIGLVGLAGLITLSAVSVLLPPLLFAPVIAAIVPAVFSGAACLTMGAAGIYMHVNRNQQTDDRYRLEFVNKEIKPDLYLDEDNDYVDALMLKYYNRKAATNQGEGASASHAHFPSPLSSSKPKRPDPDAFGDEVVFASAKC